MPLPEQLKAEIRDEETLHDLASTFSEVSAAKLGVLRGKFEENQDFFREVSDLYRLVKASTNAPEIASRGTLAIAMTTNNRFYGVINLEVMKKFLNETREGVDERLVVGKIGITHLESIGYKLPFKKMVFKKDVPLVADLEELLRLAQPFKKVLLYYPQFKTIYTQLPAVMDIAYSPTPALEKTVAENPKFIFEPELPQIVEFFETQIRAILLKRVLLEMELSVTASRLQAMSRAKEHARKMLKQRRLELAKMTQNQINARLLESLSRARKKWS